MKSMNAGRLSSEFCKHPLISVELFMKEIQRRGRLGDLFNIGTIEHLRRAISFIIKHRIEKFPKEYTASRLRENMLGLLPMIAGLTFQNKSTIHYSEETLILSLFLFTELVCFGKRIKYIFANFRQVLKIPLKLGTGLKTLYNEEFCYGIYTKYMKKN